MQTSLPISEDEVPRKLYLQLLRRVLLMVNSLEQFSMILPMPLAAWIVITYLKRFVRIST